jgi:hypothetical protein
MLRTGVVAVTLAILVVPESGAQSLRFRWQTGQTLTYRVEHGTAAAETLDGKTTQTASKLTVLKRWQVLDVDAAGVATVQKTVTAMRLEQTTPSGTPLVFDSTNPDKSDPQLREQLTKFVGVPLETLRVDATGRVVEVKECKHGPASKFESDPPFAVQLPASGAGSSWERAYKITLEPPQGTGEKYDAAQTYQVRGTAGNLVTLALTSQLKTQPESAVDRLPLLQGLPEGEVVFDTQAGRVQSVRLKVSQSLDKHQGEGSSYRFESSYVEEHVADR